MSEKKWSVRDASAILGITPQSLYARMGLGKVLFETDGDGRQVISESELAKEVVRHKEQGPRPFSMEARIAAYQKELNQTQRVVERTPK